MTQHRDQGGYLEVQDESAHYGPLGLLPESLLDSRIVNTLNFL